MKYTGRFKTVKDELIEVNIVTSDSSVNDSSTEDSSVIELVFSGDSPVTITQSSPDGIFSPIKSRSCTITVVSNTEYYNMYSSTAKGTTVEVINVSRGDLCLFSGYMTPCQYNQPYNYLNPIELEAVDGISILKNYKYTYINGSTSELKYVKDIVMNIIYSVSGYRGNTYLAKKRLRFAGSSADTMYMKISEAAFFKDDEAMSCYEVLEEICRFLNLSLVPYGREVYFIDYEVVANHSGQYVDYIIVNNSTVSLAQIEQKFTPRIIEKNDYAGDDNNIEIDMVYNKVSVKSETKEIGEDDLVCDPIDEASSSTYWNTVTSDLQRSDGEYWKSVTRIFQFIHGSYGHWLDNDTRWQTISNTNSTFSGFTSVLTDNFTNRQITLTEAWVDFPYKTGYLFNSLVGQTALPVQQFNYQSTKEMPYSANWNDMIMFFPQMEWMSTYYRQNNIPWVSNYGTSTYWWNDFYQYHAGGQYPVLIYRGTKNIAFSPTSATKTNYLAITGDILFQKDCTLDDVNYHLWTEDQTNNYYGGTLFMIKDAGAHDTETFASRDSDETKYNKGWDMLRISIRVGDKCWNGTDWVVGTGTCWLPFHKENVVSEEEELIWHDWNHIVTNHDYTYKIGKDAFVIPITMNDQLYGKIEIDIYMPRIPWTNGVLYEDGGYTRLDFRKTPPVIFMKNLSFELIPSDNDREHWYLDFSSLDNEEDDIIYSNEINSSNVEEMDELTMKINTYNEKCPISQSYIIENNTYHTGGFYRPITDTVKREELHVIDRYVEHYSSPKIIYNCTIHGYLEPWNCVRTTATNNVRMIVDEQEFDVKGNRNSVKLIQWDDADPTPPTPGPEPPGPGPEPPTPSDNNPVISVNFWIFNDCSTAATIDGDISIVLKNPDHNGNYYGGSTAPYIITNSPKIHLSDSSITIPAGGYVNFYGITWTDSRYNQGLGETSPFDPETVQSVTGHARNVQVYVNGRDNAFICRNLSPDIIFTNDITYTIIIEGGSQPPVYEDEYFKVRFLEDGHIAFSYNFDHPDSVWYSIDEGLTWNTGNEYYTIGVDGSAGDVIWFKGNMRPTESSHSVTAGGHFWTNTRYEVEGNVMSLLFGDDFMSHTSLEGIDNALLTLFEGTGIVSAENLILPTTLSDYCFVGLFNDCRNLIKPPVLTAENLTHECYGWMFRGCTSLIEAPDLSYVKNLSEYCFDSMFEGCTSLTTPPELPFISLEFCCYLRMFKDCTSLTTAPALPADIMEMSCYSSMFEGCTSLTTAPALPSLYLAQNCYGSMFKGCTSLTTPPALPATYLDVDSYQHMFEDCTSMTTVPNLPSEYANGGCYDSMFKNCISLTTVHTDLPHELSGGCYRHMYEGCINITRAPNLLANKLVHECYMDMFNGCSKLNYINARFTTDIDTYSTLYTENWVKGVSPTGTFVKEPGATWTLRGDSGIPVGWNVETGIPTPSGSTRLTFRNDGSSTMTLSFSRASGATGTLYYVASGASGTYSGGNISIPVNGFCYFYGNLRPGSDGIGTFVADNVNKFIVFGNVMSLIYGDNCEGKTTLYTPQDNFIFKRLFYNCTQLRSVSGLELPATQLSQGCYQEMFNNCYTLENTPKMQRYSLGIPQSAYKGMFRNCTHITTAPFLPATDVQPYGYAYMFEGCTSLVNVQSVLPAKTLTNNCYQGMFRYCSNLTTAPELQAGTLASGCYDTMFEHCTKLNYVKALFTTNITNTTSYTNNWLNDVAATGTFIKNSSATWNRRDEHGIPVGWTVYENIGPGPSPTPTPPPPTPTPPVPYSQQYFTLDYASGTSGGSISFRFIYGDNVPPLNNLMYSDDKGSTWNTINNNTLYTISYPKNVYIKGNIPAFNGNIGYFVFNGTIPINVYGNIMSLLYGDNFTNQTSLSGRQRVFKELFKNCSFILNTNNLILPATTLSNACYQYMFDYCTRLVTAPELPATTVQPLSYQYMFRYCTTLQTAPNLPATTVYSGGYNGMFSHCTQLRNVQATLPATRAYPEAYSYMFSNCYSLTTAPTVSFTTLEVECCERMFTDCTSLTTAQSTLPATTLAEHCYTAMYSGCTNLTTAPVLPARTLAEHCYSFMFDGCTKLNYVKAMFTTNITSNTSYTYHWLNGVASTGNFYKNSSATWNRTDENGIPSGWTVYTTSS